VALDLSTLSAATTTLREYLDRPDPDDISDSQCESFLTFAARRIQRKLRTRYNRKAANLTAPVSGVTTVPTDYVESFRLVWNGRPLERISQIAMDRQRYDSPAIGIPESFSVDNGSVTLYPTPDSEQTLTLTYYYRLDDLATVDAALSTEAPELWIYGACLEAMPFLKSEGGARSWADLFMTTVEEMNDDDLAERTSGSSQSVNLGID
jgi:hypothetical protein